MPYVTPKLSPTPGTQCLSSEDSQLAKHLFSAGFALRLREGQMPFDPLFHLPQSRWISAGRQALEQQAVRSFALHHLQPVQDLAMTSSFPDGQDHGLAEPSLHRMLLQCPQAAVDFHLPAGNLRRQL